MKTTANGVFGGKQNSGFTGERRYFRLDWMFFVKALFKRRLSFRLLKYVLQVALVAFNTISYDSGLPGKQYAHVFYSPIDLLDLYHVGWLSSLALEIPVASGGNDLRARESRDSP